MECRLRRPDRKQKRRQHRNEANFRNYQLHIEPRIPENITCTDQARGKSGVFLASTGPGDAGYELQVLDSDKTRPTKWTAGSTYNQGIPLVNPNRKPGERQLTT